MELTERASTFEDPAYQPEFHPDQKATRKLTFYPAKLSFDEKISTEELSHSQNILLMTDGTVTELLEYLSQESIGVIKVGQTIENLHENLPPSQRDWVKANELPAMVRKILLQGKSTGKNYIYAESSIFIDNLPKQFRDDLVSSNIPIGKLWSKHKLETYKTDFKATKEEACAELSGFLDVPKDSALFSRTYRVFSNGLIIMIITEKFSRHCFSD